MLQKTLRAPCHIQGIGVHSGREVAISLLPAPPDTGILFRLENGRGNGKEHVDVPAHSDFITSTTMNTSLGRDGREIRTVEHLLAALVGMEVDNVVIRTHGAEIPAMDGSALPFVSRIMEVGRETQPAPRKFLRIKAPITVEEGEKSVGLYPSDVPTFSCEIDFPHPAVGYQQLKIHLSPQVFVSDLAKARTFGFEEEMKDLHRRGLARGGSLDNGIGLGENGKVLNPDGLRYPDEFVRHKILDAVGDLALAGATILGEYRAVKPGHSIHRRLLHELRDNPERWEIVSASETQQAQAG